MEGKLFVLKVILADIDVISIAGAEMERLCLRNPGRSLPAAFSLFGVAADESGFLHFSTDLGKIALRHREVQGLTDVLQLIDFGLDVLHQRLQSFACALQLGIAVKITLRILKRRLGRIQRNRQLFPGVVVIELCAGGPGRDVIAVGVEKLSVNAVLFSFVRVFHLAGLQIIFVQITFQDGLHDLAEICGLLTDSRERIFLPVIVLDELGNGGIVLLRKIPVHGERERGVLYGLTS